MNEKRIISDAVVLKTVDYGENDKILTLLTPALGKISAGIKGVKKPNAKLKFAAQPFCFGEYALERRGERFTVVNCAEYESFFDLSSDICRYFAACAAAEAACALGYEGGECAEVFKELITAFTLFCAGKEETSAVLIKFLTLALRVSGYGISVDNCVECGSKLVEADKMRFDCDAGAFTCYDCGTGAGVSRVTYNVLRKIYNKSFIEEFITSDGEKRALKLIREYAVFKLGVEFPCLTEYIKLI